MWSFMEENQNPNTVSNTENSGHFDTERATISKEILQTELYNVTTYIDRLNFVLHHHEDLSHLPQIKLIYVSFLNNIKTEIQNALNITPILASIDDKASFLVNEINQYLKLIEIYFRLDAGSNQFSQNAVGLLNTLFQGAFELHLKVKAFSILEVQPPRFTLASIEKNEHSIILFKINDDDFKLGQSLFDATISFIQVEKEKQYDRHLKKGHFFLLNKNNLKAKEHFTKAKNFNSTAEIFTLLGHLAGKESRFDEAREYCLKAIKLDPNYGAPYNDYGVYLLNEGHAKDALKWFSLAKKSLHYQNRDFAYINSGRAYFAMGEYELALDEFIKALTMNPENNELESMVQKIKENLEAKELKDFIIKFKPNHEGIELNQ